MLVFGLDFCAEDFDFFDFCLQLFNDQIDFIFLNKRTPINLIDKRVK